MEKLKYIALGAAFGASAIALGYFVLRRITNKNLATETAVDAKRLLPKRVILVRHGESEGNVDAMMYRVKADNLLELTPKGIEQATAAGERLKKILGNERVELYVSPFERTLQTQRSLRVAIESNIIDTWVDPLIREQEFGNLQGEDF